MPRVAPRVPELSEILCSSCGYVLNGLPDSGACPECGKPIIQSLDAHRTPPQWESADPTAKASAFLQTTSRIVFRPARFYRTFTTRGDLADARRFARLHWWLASALFAITGATHAVWFSYHISSSPPNFPGGSWVMFAAIAIGLTAATYFALDLLTRMAAKLTTLEANYRGYRLPYDIVLRAMYYHAAHYLPVALGALVLVEGYQLLLQTAVAALPPNHAIVYLYALCGLVVLCAIYLFQTYWIGMRSMMYANR